MIWNVIFVPLRMLAEVAATLLSRMAVPVVYYLLARGGRADSLRRQGLPPEAAA